MKAQPPTGSTPVVVALLLIFGLLAGTSSASELASKTRVTILLTTLSYDLNLGSRGNTLRIGVVSASESGPSTTDGKDILAAFEAASSKRVKGMAISAVGLKVSGGPELKEAIKAKNINVLYLSSHLGSLQGAALNLAKELKILSICGELEAVKAGAAIGVVQENRKPKILVNLQAAEAQGAKLDARLLRLVQVVK